MVADSCRVEQGGLRSRYQLHVDARHQKGLRSMASATDV
jgi:hypothetical protein